MCLSNDINCLYGGLNKSLLYSAFYADSRKSVRHYTDISCDVRVFYGVYAYFASPNRYISNVNE